MKSLLLSIIIGVGFTGISYSQLPVIKANSAKADIRDGLHFKKGAWTISPSSKLSKYYIEIPRRDHRVIFYTDIDSIRFDVSYGGVYNFAILLNGKDTCFTQLIASPEKNISYTSPHENGDQPDTIPFSLHDSKIYLRAAINQSDSVNLLLDLSQTSFIAKNKNIIKDKNQLSIAGVRWDSLDMKAADELNDKKADAIAGNFLFSDKVVKVDYDNKQIIVYNSLSRTDTGYSRHELVLNHGAPMIQAAISTKDTSCMTWFALATGNSTNSFVDQATASQYNLYKGSNKYFSWGDEVYVKFPELKIANLSFLNISSNIAKQNAVAGINEVGNGLMKRFNMILDNQNGFIYLKPNSLRASPYDNTFLIIYSILTAIVILLFLIIVFIIRAYRKKRRNHFAGMRNADNYDGNYYPESAT
jgi:hypothetical protein